MCSASARRRLPGQTCAAYLGSYLQGRDVLMIARAHETCRELSRRVRDDLRAPGPGRRHPDRRRSATAPAPAPGTSSSPAANDHQLQAGEQQRTLANGDVMRVDHVNGDGSLTVRRRTGQDPQTGQACWSAATFRFADTANADLAYAVTGHSAQGLTVSHGIAVVTGGEGRQWFYSAITRGADCNQAIVFTQPSARRTRPPGPGPRRNSPGTSGCSRSGAASRRRPRSPPVTRIRGNRWRSWPMCSPATRRSTRRWTCWRANSATPTTWPAWTRD